MPIRLGIIGLSADSGAWATMAHVSPLKSAALSKEYTITAVATSSPESAKAAAKAHGIAEEKAYSSPEAIANDPDVDMVVVSVKLPLHKQLLMPALKAKKDVYVEWPLGKDLEQAEEMTALAKSQGVKTVVGLQARQSLVVLKAKEIISSRALGRIRSTNLVISSSGLQDIPDRARTYYNDPKSGANVISIPAAHVLDPMCFLLGEFKTLNATSATNFPEIRWIQQDGSKSAPEKKNIADWISVQGILESGASASFAFTCTTAATPEQFSWIISGEKGSLKFEGTSFAIQMGQSTLYQYIPGEGAKWEEVKIPPDSGHFGGIGEVYAAFAEGKKEGLVDFDEAVKRHKMVEAIYRSAEKGTRESYGY